VRRCTSSTRTAWSGETNITAEYPVRRRRFFRYRRMMLVMPPSDSHNFYLTDSDTVRRVALARARKTERPDSFRPAGRLALRPPARPLAQRRPPCARNRRRHPVNQPRGRVHHLQETRLRSHPGSGRSQDGRLSAIQSVVQEATLTRANSRASRYSVALKTVAYSAGGGSLKRTSTRTSVPPWS
jgi:hypothetical protein